MSTQIEQNTYSLEHLLEIANSLPDAGGAAEPELQDKTITENGTYEADPGYDGLGQVTVNVTSGGAAALPDGVTAIDSGTFTPASDTKSVSVIHGLGVIPSFWVIVPENGGFTVGSNAGYLHSLMAVMKPFTVGTTTNKGRYAVSYASSTGSIMSGSATTMGLEITVTGVEFTAYSGTSAKFKGGTTYRWIACAGTDFT